MRAFLTPLNILYTIAIVLSLSCFAEMFVYGSSTLKIKRWKPDMYKMHYIIRTNVEKCIPHFFYNEDSDTYIVEFREMLTGRLILSQVLTAEEHYKMVDIESINIEVSTLRLYIITPNQHVVYKDFIRTDRSPNYREFKEKDISTNMLLLAAEHFKRRCPLKRNISKKKESDIEYVKKLPYAVTKKR